MTEIKIWTIWRMFSWAITYTENLAKNLFLLKLGKNLIQNDIYVFQI